MRSGTTTMKMISSTSTTSTSGVMLISDCRLDPESLLLNCICHFPSAPARLAISPTPWKPACSIASMASRTWRKLSFASPRITTLGSFSMPTAALRASLNCSAATGRSLIHSPPASSMETKIRPLSSPCEFGFVVFGTLTSGPFRICGAITMKIISSTSTTSTSGVMLMAACILAGSPSRISRPSLFHPRHFDFSDFDVKNFELRYFEQAVHELGRSPIHLDMESLNLAREAVEGDNGRNCDEDTQGRRDQGLRNAARNHRHSAGPRGRNASESVNDSDDRAEKTDERSTGADRGKEPETPFQLNQRFRHGVSECARDELERSDRVASALTHSVVLHDARRDYLRHVGILVPPSSLNQILDLSPVKELLELGLEVFRLARGQAEAAVLIYNHRHRKNGKQSEA